MTNISNSLRAHIYLYMFQKTPYAPSVVPVRIRSYAISRISCNHHHHNILLLLLLQSRYLLSRNSWSADFFAERLQICRRCARTWSDRFFLVASDYGRSWSSSTVERVTGLFWYYSMIQRECLEYHRCVGWTEQRHLLLTQHQWAAPHATGRGVV